jgi:hypothetical protein
MKMKKKFLTGVIVVLLMLGVTSIVHAYVYDAASDFSPTDNPNGAWSYRWSIDPENTFNLDTVNGVFDFVGISYPGLDYWARDSVSYPIILHNSTSVPITIERGSGPGLEILPNELVQHPGSDSSYSLLRWTAPDAGTFEVASVFKGIDMIGVTADVHVILNGTTIYDGYVNGYGDSSMQSFFDTLTLVAGNTIDFAVGAGGNGYVADTTAIAASITPVPLPAALYLFGSGLLLLIGKRLQLSV